MAGTFKERQKKRTAIILTVLVLLFLSFFAYSLFGESGILMNMRVDEEAKKLEAHRDMLLKENSLLEQEIMALKTNSRKIESLGRQEFGFGRPGEIIFYFPDDKSRPVQEIHHPGSDNVTPDPGKYKP